MSKYFRRWNIDQTLLLPPNVQDFVPKGHVSRFIVELVRESLDLKDITGSYVSGLGQPPFDPRMMVALLLHGYASGLYSSRRIAKACRERNDFVMIVALDPPDFRTISDFRKRTADPTDAKEDRRRWLRNTLPIEKASGRTGVRTDQTGPRLPPVPVAGRRKSARRVGHDLHRPQRPEAVHPRNGCLSRLTCQ